MKPSDLRPPFDPRQRFAVELCDLGPITVCHSQEPSPREERRLVMDVLIDGEREIFGGLVLEADDLHVAFDECGMCGLWECNLVDGYSAKVRRVGPYVLWLRPYERVYTFDVDEYERALGGSTETLPTLTEDDEDDLDDPDDEAAYPCSDGRVLAVNDDAGPLAALRGWPIRSDVDAHPVTPPSEAVEVRALNGLSASIWIDARPREDGRRAAFLPAVTAARVWCAGDAVDRVVTALFGD